MRNAAPLQRPDVVAVAQRAARENNPPLIAEVYATVPAPRADGALHLFVVLEKGDLLIYRGFGDGCAATCSPELPLVFVRVDHHTVLRPPRSVEVNPPGHTRRTPAELQGRMAVLDRRCHFVEYCGRDGDDAGRAYLFCERRPAYIHV